MLEPVGLNPVAVEELDVAARQLGRATRGPVDARLKHLRAGLEAIARARGDMLD